MKLGYLRIPPLRHVGVPTSGVDRTGLARKLGFAEFYAIGEQSNSAVSTVPGDSPEQAQLLRISSDMPETPIPQIVFSDGQARPSRASAAVLNSVTPSQTPEQIKSLALRNYAPLSVSWLTNSQLAEHWSAHVTGSTHAGLRARPEDWRVARTVVVCDDRARAEAAVKYEDSICRAYYSKVATMDLSSAQLDAVIDACVICGTLASVLEELQELAATAGPFGTLTLVDHSWPDPKLACESMALLANAVIPHFNEISLQTKKV